MGKKLTTDIFIERAKNAHGDSHDYSEVDYINSRTKVIIRCKKHNSSFLQKPSTHLMGVSGCTFCYKENMALSSAYSDEYYINHIKDLKLPYDIININGGEKITMSCKKHGNFTANFTTIRRSKKSRCPNCRKEENTQGTKKDTESFIIRAKEVQGDKCDYSKINYVDHKTDVEIICNTCGKLFKQKPSAHLSGKGCSNCWTNRNREDKIQNRVSVEEVSKICNIIFNNTLDFSRSECVTSNDKMEVFCKKCNSSFTQYKCHLVRGVGCQRCSKEEKESKPEKRITKILLDKGIEFNKEHSFDGCVYKKKLRFDFFIPNINTCIEYQGEQHYRPIEIFGGIKAYELQIEKDNVKREYCKNNNIQLIEIAYSDNIEEKLECFTKYKLDETE